MRQSLSLKIIKGYAPMVQKISAREHWAQTQSRADMQRYTETLRTAAQKAVLPEKLIIDACALVREVGVRMLGERIYDVQIFGALALHDGMVVEMKTGEGKTISSVPALYLNAVSGEGVHVVTVNDYLAKRDALWMKGLFDYLNISSSYINAETSQEQRKLAYQADITYGTNNEFGFDYLRDNLCLTLGQKVQRGHNFCIIDEADSILIDEARTPLIISGIAEDNMRYYAVTNTLARQLQECEKNQEGEYDEDAPGDYKLERKNRHVSFTDEGMEHIEKLLTQNRIISESLYSGGNFEFVHYFTQAIRAQKLYALDVDYVIQDRQVQIIDEFTGRILSGRRYSDGLHQAIEAKEKIPIARKSRTVATITLQNYFRQYRKISGMTGTAATEERELGKIYGLSVAVIPTNRPIARVDHNDLIYPTEQAKHVAIINDIKKINAAGQPILLGTTTIEKSEQLSRLLHANNLKHTVLNAKNHSREAEIVAQAGRVGNITIATNMAGRGTDIKLGGDPNFANRLAHNAEQIERTEDADSAVRIQKMHAEQLEEVCRAGGLCVIGTERHDSRRIDNQLRGRSGRQGDPGISRFYISLDDHLMQLFGERRKLLQSIMERGLGETQALDHPIINKSIEKAQRRVEERNFEVRKHLLEFDDVINEQRSIVYGQRDDILTDSALSVRLQSTVAAVTEQQCAAYQKQHDLELRDRALRSVSDLLLIDQKLYNRNSDDIPVEYDNLVVYITDFAKSDLESKEKFFGADQWNIAIRQEYLRNIDKKWQDHLESLDALREAVYLRSYAQKNPLLEYKIEGFQMFDQMLVDIRLSVAKRFFAIRIEQIPQLSNTIHIQQNALNSVLPQHRSFNQFENNNSIPAVATSHPARRNSTTQSFPHHKHDATQRSASVVEPSPPERKKVGRNDPCPCGSNKKYKYCHGR